MNTRLFVGGDVSLNSRLFVANDVSMNTRLFVGGDVSLNSRLFVAKDVSLNTRLFVGGDVSLNSRLFVANDVSMNTRLFVGGDVSLNSKLFVRDDVSMNTRMFVGGDVSLNSKLFVANDVSMNTRLFVGGDVSLNSRLFVANDVSMNTRLFVGGDVSLNSRLFVANDVSMNTRLFVGGDVSLNSRLFVANDVSFNGNLVLNGKLTAGSIYTNKYIGDIGQSYNSNISQIADKPGTYLMYNRDGLEYTDIINEFTSNTNGGIRLQSYNSFNGKYVGTFLSANNINSYNNPISVTNTIPFSTGQNIYGNITYAQNGTTFTSNSGIFKTSMILIPKETNAFIPTRVSDNENQTNVSQYAGTYLVISSTLVYTNSLSANGSMENFTNGNLIVKTQFKSPPVINAGKSGGLDSSTGCILPNNYMYVGASFNHFRIVTNIYNNSTYKLYPSIPISSTSVAIATLSLQPSMSTFQGNINATTSSSSTLYVHSMTSGIILAGMLVNINNNYRLITRNVESIGAIGTYTVIPALNTFTPIVSCNTSYYISALTCNSLGTSIIIAIPRGNIYNYSNNSYVSMNFNFIIGQNGHPLWSCIKCDSTGDKIIVGCYDRSIVYLYSNSVWSILINSTTNSMSLGSGLTLPVYSTFTNITSGITMNSDGQTIFISQYANYFMNIVGAEGYNMISTDGGSTWTFSSAEYALRDCHISSDGTVIIGTKYSPGILYNTVYYSTNTGSAFNTLTNGATTISASYAYLSNNDTIIYATSTNIYKYDILSSTHTALTTINNYISSIITNSDYSKIIALSNAGFIYYSTNSGTNWSSVTNPAGSSYNTFLCSDSNMKYTYMTMNTSVYYFNDRQIIKITENIADTLNIAGATTINNNLTTTGNVTIGGSVSFNSNFIIQDDVSMNSRLFVGRDVSLNSRLFVANDVSMNSRLFVGGDVSLNSRLFVANDVSMNSRLFVGGDVSLNSRLFVANDVSMNSRLFVGGDVSLNSRLFVANDVSMNSRLFVGGDVSLNSRLFVANDVSMNSRLFVGGDVSLNSRLFVANDVSMNTRLFVGGDVSLNSKFFVEKDSYFNGNLVVVGTLTTKSSGMYTNSIIGNYGAYNSPIPQIANAPGSYSMYNKDYSNASYLINESSNAYGNVNIGGFKLQSYDVCGNYLNTFINATSSPNFNPIALSLPSFSRVGAVFNASFTGTTMTVNSIVSGTLAVGQYIIGSSYNNFVNVAPYISSGTSSPYTINNSIGTLNNYNCVSFYIYGFNANANITNFTTLNVTTNPNSNANGGNIITTNTIVFSGANYPNPISGYSSGGDGDIGSYALKNNYNSNTTDRVMTFLNIISSSATFYGQISGTILTVDTGNLKSGTIAVGQAVTGTGITPFIINGYGTGIGSAGTYTISVNQSITTPTLMTAKPYVSDLACSADGSVVYICVPMFGIYKSTNYGNNWTESTVYISATTTTYNNLLWSTISCSASGNIILAGASNSSIVFSSTDYGTTWTTPITGDFVSAASSTDTTSSNQNYTTSVSVNDSGSIYFVSQSTANSSANNYYYNSTWKRVTIGTQKALSNTYISSDGTYVIGIDGATGYYSSNVLTGFNTYISLSTITNHFLTKNMKYIYYYNSSQINKLTTNGSNSPVSAETIATTVLGNINAIAASYDGNIVIGVGNSNIIYSTDNGKNYITISASAITATPTIHIYTNSTATNTYITTGTGLYRLCNSQTIDLLENSLDIMNVAGAINIKGGPLYIQTTNTNGGNDYFRMYKGNTNDYVFHNTSGDFARNILTTSGYNQSLFNNTLPTSYTAWRIAETYLDHKGRGSFGGFYRDYSYKYSQAQEDVFTIHTSNSSYWYFNTSRDFGFISNENTIWDINGDGVINTNNVTASISTSTGALKVAGGIGVAKRSYFGETNVKSCAVFQGEVSFMKGIYNTGTVFSTKYNGGYITGYSTDNFWGMQFGLRDGNVDNYYTNTRLFELRAGGVSNQSPQVLINVTSDNIHYGNSTTYIQGYSTDIESTGLGALIVRGSSRFGDHADIKEYTGDNKDVVQIYTVGTNNYWYFNTDKKFGLIRKWVIDGDGYAEFNSAKIKNDTVATSTDSGALQVTGGLGVGQKSFFGQDNSNPCAVFKGAVSFMSGRFYPVDQDTLIDSDSYNGGYISGYGWNRHHWGMQFGLRQVGSDNGYQFTYPMIHLQAGDSGNNTPYCYINCKTKIKYSEDSTSTDSGALQVTGGLGVAKNSYFGGSIYVNAARNTPSNILQLNTYNGTGSNSSYNNTDFLYFNSGDANGGIPLLGYHNGANGSKWTIRADGYAYFNGPLIIKGGLEGDDNFRAYTSNTSTSYLYFTPNARFGYYNGTASNWIITNDGEFTGLKYNATSDYRIKDNVEPLTTETVDPLRPVKYYNKKLEKEDIGLIAHEVQEHYPFLVTGEKDGKDMQTINYTGLIGILIKEIQDLKKRVSELEMKNM
jgi:UDP-3-O-[3-hydroxymyristoyl] glucosamine N-acyltransferase